MNLTNTVRLGRRGSYCAKALMFIDSTGALFRLCFGTTCDAKKTSANDALVLADDSVIQERQLRLAAKAASMDAGEYMRYAEARQVSLYVLLYGLCFCLGENTVCPLPKNFWQSATCCWFFAGFSNLFFVRPYEWD